MFKSYFVDRKTGKMRTKGKTVFLFIMFAVLLIFLSSAFFGMATLLLDLVKGPYEFHWLYFAVMGILAVVLGVFGSVFNTYASLYLSKDNELLLSLPIPPSKILSSRIVIVYGLSLLYSGLVWLPASIMYYIFGGPGVLAIIFTVLLLFIISLFVTVLTCILGFFVAALAVRLKNNAIITVFITLAAIGGYYFVWFRMTDTLKGIVLNSALAGSKIKKWGNVFYLLGKASAGDIKSMVIFTALTVLLFAACIFVLSKTFLGISTLKGGKKKSSVPAKTAKKQKKTSSTLLTRELKRFLSSPTYMLNCALGTLIGPVCAIAVIIKRKALLDIIKVLGSSFDVYDYLPVLLAAVGLLILSMNTLSTPSISLEGRQLWIIRSMPVNTADILKAKRNFHIMMTLPTTIISVIVIGFALNLYKEEILIIALILFLATFFEADIGLILGLHRSEFDWANETKPIKQSLNSLIILLIGWIMPVIAVGGYYLLDRYSTPVLNSFIFLCVLAVVFGLAALLADKRVFKKDLTLFEEF